MRAHDALILCGGLGTRLRPAVFDRPKGLAVISGRPFLDILVEELRRQGFDRLVFCVGHGSDQVIRHFQNRADAQFVFSIEDRALGTGGAIAHALPHVVSDPFAVVNGDSICRVDYADLFAFHGEKRALATVVVAPPSERTDVGVIDVAADARVVRFAEKPAGAGAVKQLVNAGIYVMQRRLFSDVREVVFSLEHDLLPRAIASRACFAYRVDGPVIDIGTPERYRVAQGLLR
jgi:D-glycero-alpha-D-manno-heptose 1-phosphate guanylyltransferase